MRYRVLVDDNFHYMDESHRYELGRFDSPEAALDACRRIVDGFLLESHKPGMTADELLTLYAFFGEDPFIVSDDPACRFSGREYAGRRAVEICGAPS